MREHLQHLNRRHYLLASDFDETTKNAARGWRAATLIQQGGALAYLIRHAPEFRGVRQARLVEAGKRVRLTDAIPGARGLPRPGPPSLPVLLLCHLRRAAT